MPYGITPEGFVLKTFDVIRSEINEDQRSGINRGLILSDDDPLGIVNASMTLKFAELWELAQVIYNGGDPDTATGWALRQMAALTGTKESPWTYTTVVAKVTLNPDKALPAGSVAHLSGRPSVRFTTIAEVPADPSGGTFDVDFVAENPGSIDVLIGQLDTIAIAVSGWTAVTNDVAGIPGSQPENDPELRDKRERELASTGGANIEAIIAGVSQVDGVIEVTGRDNTYPVPILAYPDMPLLPAHTFVTIVRGGTDNAVAQAIYDSKSGGIGTFGNFTETITDSESYNHTVRFQRAFAENIYVDIVVNTTTGWLGGDSIALLKQRIADYINSLKISGDVIYLNVIAQAFTVPGLLRVDACQIGKGIANQIVDLPIGSYFYAVCDVTNVDVTVV